MKKLSKKEIAKRQKAVKMTMGIWFNLSKKDQKELFANPPAKK